MFGTDHPFFPPLKGQTRWESVDDNLNAISELLPKNQQNMVLAGNAERILGICQ